ncbi:unnamed protein product [Ambrosiozyma monospora]|uniref:Unnamed protein product n=1 Tax=Ambrosiozyma monospora TaxID=43982 RepID=A0ACB5SSB4_AMBMO|nr:unnamed protein product [Ambrosiozyma monospora]
MNNNLERQHGNFNEIRTVNPSNNIPIELLIARYSKLRKICRTYLCPKPITLICFDFRIGEKSLDQLNESYHLVMPCVP